jgi:hypothetical protein
MKRKKYKSAKTIKCKLCGDMISSYGFVNHIKSNTHQILYKFTLDDYIKKFGEFRKTKLDSKRNRRNINKTTCNICNKEFVMVGMSGHLMDTHGISTDNYVMKHGEFRINRIIESDRKSKSNIKCEVCNKKQVSHAGLIYHIKTHNITWQDYFVKFFYNNNHPTCTCGCNEKVALLKSGVIINGKRVFVRSMLSGHNLNKPGYRTCTHEQRMKMRKSAIKRMERGDGTYFNTGPSVEENKLYDFVKQLCSDAIQNDRDILSGLELDIVIPSLKIAIEYNGGYFHSDIFKNKKYHLNKQRDAKIKGYRLIHIWESDWLYKTEITKSIIKSIMGTTKQKIYARKTTLKEISFSESNEFLHLNHLQGRGISKIRIGLFDDDELVSVMTFSSLRPATGQVAKDGYYELQRFCNKLDTTVIGGASKLFKYFQKNYIFKSIISYANKDWSVGSLYDKLGMTYIGDTAIGYFYVKSKHRYNRFQFQKHKLVESGADPKLTEYEIMLKNGFYRIWDCGNLKYEFTK